MYWRQGLKSHKAALALTCYAALYFCLAWLTAPAPRRIFLADRSRIRGGYALVYLASEEAVADSVLDLGKECGRCFVTGNREFVPMGEYDAVLVRPAEYGQKKYGRKAYVLNASDGCIAAKFKGCEANATRASTRKSYDLCGFCAHVWTERELQPFVII